MLKKLMHNILPTRASSSLEGSHDLILHFSYHKCMTAYFVQVFAAVTKRMKWDHKHHNGDIESFYNSINKQNQL